MQGEVIYQIMNGEINREEITLPVGIDVMDEFDEGKKCGQLYDKVYEAKLRLGERLGIDEDSDVEEIISCMNSISRILAVKMFEYGMKLGANV